MNKLYLIIFKNIIILKILLLEIFIYIQLNLII